MRSPVWPSVADISGISDNDELYVPRSVALTLERRAASPSLQVRRCGLARASHVSPAPSLCCLLRFRLRVEKELRLSRENTILWLELFSITVTFNCFPVKQFNYLPTGSLDRLARMYNKARGERFDVRFHYFCSRATSSKRKRGRERERMTAINNYWNLGRILGRGWAIFSTLGILILTSINPNTKVKRPCIRQ